MKEIIQHVICLAVGYLIGSVLFANILVKLLKGLDIREMGNNNPGAQNIYLHISKVLGVLAGLLDAFKAFIPMILANQYLELSDMSLGLLGIGALLGHVYPLYFRFNGGRGAAVIIGLFMFFIKWELLLAFIIAPIVVYIAFKHQSMWLPYAILMSAATFAMFAPHSPEVKIIIIATVVLGWTYNIRNLPVMVKMVLKRE